MKSIKRGIIRENYKINLDYFNKMSVVMLKLTEKRDKRSKDISGPTKR